MGNDDWRIDRYEGYFAPSAWGPKNIGADLDDTGKMVRIEHEVPAGYLGGTSTEAAHVPRAWLEELFRAHDEFKKRKAPPNG